MNGSWPSSSTDGSPFEPAPSWAAQSSRQASDPSRSRGIDRGTERGTAALSVLKHVLEVEVEKVFEIYIRATPEDRWEAIVDTEIRSKYSFGARVTSDWTPGSRFEMIAPKVGTLLGEGENLEVDRPRRLAQSFVALWSDEVKGEGSSRVT